MRLPGYWITRLALYCFVLAAYIALAGEVAAALDQTREADPGANATAAQSEPSGQPESARYAIMVGLFPEEAAARILADNLRGDGLTPYLLTSRNATGEEVYAVRLDIYDSLIAALQAKTTFAEKTTRAMQITPEGSLTPVNLASKTFLVQTGIYDSEASAKEALGALVKKGIIAGGFLPLHAEDEPVRILIHAGIHGAYDDAVRAAATFASTHSLATSVNVVETDLFVSRHVDAKTAVPQAFQKPAAPKKKPQPKATFTRKQPAPAKEETNKNPAPAKDGERSPSPSGNTSEPAQEPSPKEAAPEEKAPVPLPTPPDAFPPPESSRLDLPATAVT